MTAQSYITITGTASGNGKFNSSEQGVGGALLVASANFEDANIVPASIVAGVDWGTYSAGLVSVESGALKYSYPSGISNSSTSINLSILNTKEIYIQFRAKMPNIKYGFKFVKIFGVRATGGIADGAGDEYANTTIQCDYSGGSSDPTAGKIYQIAFGQGSDVGNDVAQVIELSGGNSTATYGSRNASAIVTTPQNSAFTPAMWGSAWHNFKIKVKFDSSTNGNPVADGAYYLEIDGNVYVDATGLFNRHYSNLPIDSVQFGGWSQSGDTAFEVYYDDIKISTGGFV